APFGVGFLKGAGLESTSCTAQSTLVAGHGVAPVLQPHPTTAPDTTIQAREGSSAKTQKDSTGRLIFTSTLEIRRRC
ncbi:MAG: hypothetical protein P4L50_13985, partial [Anaerolineaceae bacterium]|nr:hypothetical protein [Anaerolineaceae bacterium]